LGAEDETRYHPDGRWVPKKVSDIAVNRMSLSGTNMRPTDMNFDTSTGTHKPVGKPIGESTASQL
jgi:hypothetical protein